MNKKTFMATMAILALLLSLFGMQFVKVVNANPFVNVVPFPTPITDKPTILLAQPPSNITAQNLVSLAFTVTMPDSWYWTYSNTNFNITTQRFIGGITSTNCTFDQIQIINDKTTYGGYDFKKPDKTAINYGQILAAPSLGEHTIKISVEFYTIYSATSSEFDWDYYNGTSEATYTFFVSAPTSSASPTPSASPSPTPEPSPSVAEFPTWTALPLVLAAFAGVVVLVCVRKRRLG